MAEPRGWTPPTDRLTYRVSAVGVDAAQKAAKERARAEGRTIRTVCSVHLLTTGVTLEERRTRELEWDVVLAVRS